MKKSVFVKLLVFAFSLFLSLLIAELVFRWMVFGKNPKFQHLRNPGLYASETSDDYWKLYYRLDGFYKPPKNPQPVLGFISRFDRITLDHDNIDSLKNKRPVLLYGDSFAQCIDTVECFQHILNRDSSFNSDYYLLNYGVGGYGVDQIYLLCSLTVNKFNNPYVIFSILPADMDRSLLTVRTGQKPFFVIENDALVLKGVPINPNPDAFFKENPPSIISYLYAYFLRSDLNPFISLNEGSPAVKKKILDLNEKIILQVERKLKSKGLEHVFLLYDPLYTADGDWRTKHLAYFFSKNNLPFIFSSELVYADTRFPEFDFDRYILKGQGHPTSYYNWLTAQEIKQAVFGKKNYSEALIDNHKMLSDTACVEFFEHQIMQNEDWLNGVKQKAIEKNIPLDSAIRSDAKWLADELKQKQGE